MPLWLPLADEFGKVLQGPLDQKANKVSKVSRGLKEFRGSLVLSDRKVSKESLVLLVRLVRLHPCHLAVPVVLGVLLHPLPLCHLVVLPVLLVRLVLVTTNNAGHKAHVAVQTIADARDL